MPRRRQRIERKLHKWYLSLGIIDLSYRGPWRKWLLAAPLYQPFIIDSWHVEGLHPRDARAVRRYSLTYRVYRVPQSESGWDGFDFGDGNYAYFRFEAARYPDIYSITANNSEC